MGQAVSISAASSVIPSTLASTNLEITSASSSASDTESTKPASAWASRPTFKAVGFAIYQLKQASLHVTGNLTKPNRMTYRSIAL